MTNGYRCVFGVTVLFVFSWVRPAVPLQVQGRADSRLAPSQWETALQSNAVSHWLGANLESALQGSLSATLAMAVAAAMGSVHHPVPGISWEAWIKHQCGRYMIICLRFPPDIFPAFNVALQVHFETYCISRDAIRGVLGYQSWLIRWRRWQRPWLRHWMFLLSWNAKMGIMSWISCAIAYHAYLSQTHILRMVSVIHILYTSVLVPCTVTYDGSIIGCKHARMYPKRTVIDPMLRASGQYRPDYGTLWHSFGAYRDGFVVHNSYCIMTHYESSILSILHRIENILGCDVPYVSWYMIYYHIMISVSFCALNFKYHFGETLVIVSSQNCHFANVTFFSVK